MNGDPWLLLRLLVAMTLALGVAAALARALGRRLRFEVGLASIALPIALLAPWLTGDRILLPTGSLALAIPGSGMLNGPDPYSLQLNDVTLQLAPWEIEVRRQLTAGQLPFWSDRIDGGSSPWADPQASVLAPTSIAARLLPARHHFLAALALKIQLALCGTWVAARSFAARRRTALLAAAGFALGGGLLAWGLFPISAVAAWAPWVFAAALQLARRPSPSRGAWFAAVAVVAAAMLSGHPELAFATGSLAAVVAAVYGRRRRRPRAVFRIAIVGLLAFGFAAPALVPFAAVAFASQRFQDRAEERQSPSVSPPWHRTERPRILVSALSPRIAGLPFERSDRATNLYAHSGYAGLATVAGVALALAGRRSRRRALPLVVAAFVTYAFAARTPGWVDAWEAIPLLQVQEPSRIAPLGALFLVLAAAIGLDEWMRRPRQRIPILAALSLLALAAAVAPAPDVLAISTGLGVSLLLATRSPRLSILLMAVFLVADLVPWGRRLLPPGDPRLFYPETADIKALRTAAGGLGGRAVGHDRLAYPAILSVYGLSDPRTHNPLAGAAYHRALAAAFDFRPSNRNYFAPFRRPEHPLLDFLGVRAVLTNAHLPSIPGMRRLPLSSRPRLLAVNRDALPRAFVTRSYDRVAAGELESWIATMVDPRRVALDPGEVAARLPRAGLRLGRARVVDHRDDRLAIEVRGTGHRLLATSYRGPDGWRARAGDGRVLETLTVNGAFLGVIVPPNARRVELVFRPPGLGLGLLLAGASSVAAALGFVAMSRRRRLAPTG